MLAMAVRNTRKLIREKSASDHVRLGRFFTKKESAALMAGMFEFEETRPILSILDPGAGTGILSAALLEAVCRGRAATEIRLVCYENGAAYLPMLKNNLERLRKRCRREYGVRLIYEVREENFLLSAMREDELYDCIIMNPPRELADKASPEAMGARDLLTTPTVDLAYLFLAAAAMRLSDEGQMSVMLPIAFASGVSLTRLRRTLFSECRVTAMHLFTSPKGLKKQFVLGLRRTEDEGGRIRIAASPDSGTPEKLVRLPSLEYDFAVRRDGEGLLLIGEAEDLRVLELLGRFPCSFSSFGLRMKTGLTLPSRYPDLLLDAPARGAVPLIHPRSIRGGRVIFPVRELKGQFLRPSIPSLIQPNRNMLLIKRFPASSERRLVAAAYMASQASGYRYISTHNKLNYVDTDGAEMDAPFLVGLYAVLSTKLYDRYIRIISRSGQINATELSDLPLPDAETLRAIGSRLIAVRRFEPEICDMTVMAQIKRMRGAK